MWQNADKNRAAGIILNFARVGNPGGWGDGVTLTQSPVPTFFTS